MAWGHRDDRDPLERALDAAAGLKAGSWASVEALAMLSLATAGQPQARTLYESAKRASGGLSSGSWDSIRALTWLAKAHAELGQDADD